MPYDPRAFPEFRKSVAGVIEAPRPPAKKRQAEQREAEFRGRRRTAVILSVLALAGFAGALAWERGSREPAPRPAPSRAALTVPDLEKWSQTMTYLAEKRKGGGFAGLGSEGLRGWLVSAGPDASVVADACAFAKWSKEDFIATSAAVQVSVDLLAEEAAGRRVFASERDGAAKALVAERREEIEARLEAVK